MFRRRISLLSSLPSLISMLSTRAATVPVRPQRQAAAAAAVETTHHDASLLQQPATAHQHDHLQQQHQQNVATLPDITSALSQLRTLRAEYNQLEARRRSECERLERALAQSELLLRDSSVIAATGNSTRNAEVDEDDANRDDDDTDDDLASRRRRAQKNLARKLSRERIASSGQRHVLRRAVRLLRHRKVKLALQSTASAFRNRAEQSTPVELFTSFVSDVAFFSAALRKLRAALAQELKHKAIATKQTKEQQEQSKLLLDFGSMVSVVPRKTQALIADAIRSLAVAPNPVPPRAAISLLFSGTKAGVLGLAGNSNTTTTTAMFLSALVRAASSSSTGTAAQVTATDTVRLTAWLTASVVAAEKEQRLQQQRPDDEQFLLLHQQHKQLYSVLRTLWIAHAPHFGGAGASEAWFILSCIPELEACLASSDSNSQQHHHQQQQLDDAITCLVSDALRGVEVPVSAQQFAQPRNAGAGGAGAEGGVHMDRLATVEIELAQMHPRKLFAVLSLLRRHDDKQSSSSNSSSDARATQKQFSLARTAVFGALARSLHRLSIGEAGMLLLLASGPCIDGDRGLATRSEAAAVSHLIDSIFVQIIEWLELHIRQPNGLRNPTERRDTALTAVRCLTALAHLSDRKFLLGKSEAKQQHEYQKPGRGKPTAPPTAKSKILSERHDVGGPVLLPHQLTVANKNSLHNLKQSTMSSSKQLKAKYSKDQLATMFMTALLACETTATSSTRPPTRSPQQQQKQFQPPLIDLLSDSSVATLERSLHALGALTQARKQELDRVRSGSGRSIGVQQITSSRSTASVLDDVEEKMREVRRLVAESIIKKPHN